MKQILFTIGHSSHPADLFISYLGRYEIETVFDVRSNPYSRFQPQYRYEALKRSLKQSEIRYVFCGKELGARPKAPECYINGRIDFRRISDTLFFREGLDRLIKVMQTCRGCLLCAERDPLFCHRFILICRHLRYRNFEIRHILADGTLESQRIQRDE